MTQQQVKHSQGMNIPSALSYFVLSFPFIRIQTFVQTQASFPGLTTEFIKKPANFYKGGCSYFAKYCGEILLGGIPAFYPLELQQIRAASYKGEYEASIQSAVTKITNKANWTGFLGVLASKSFLFVNLYSVINGFYFLMPLTCLGEVVLDNVRRNFVVRNIEGEKVSYKQVFVSLVKDKNILRGWQFYPSIYFSVFVAGGMMLWSKERKD